MISKKQRAVARMKKAANSRRKRIVNFLWRWAMRRGLPVQKELCDKNGILTVTEILQKGGGALCALRFCSFCIGGQQALRTLETNGNAKVKVCCRKELGIRRGGNPLDEEYNDSIDKIVIVTDVDIDKLEWYKTGDKGEKKWVQFTLPKEESIEVIRRPDDEDPRPRFADGPEEEDDD